MASSGSVFSGTLQTITTTKLEELAEQRLVFETQYKQLQDQLSKLPDSLERLFVLVDSVKTCFGITTIPSKDATSGRVEVGSNGNPRLETDLKNLDRFLEQARYDPSVSPKVLKNWENMLLQYLSIQSTKYTYADLYGRLVTEWLSSEKSGLSDSNENPGDSYEGLPGAKKLEARAEWEKVVFEPAPVDLNQLADYLEHLFDSKKEDTDPASGVPTALNALRRNVKAFESRLRKPQQFNVDNLSWVIMGLQSSDLLSNEQREVLKDFVNNDIILNEIADVLNMRMAALNRWSWGEHVPLEERRNVNGGYSIHMQEDLLQAIFLQYIGVKWSVFFKQNLSAFRHGAWKSNQKTVPRLDRLRRGYYLGTNSTQTHPNLQSVRADGYRKLYFSHQLLDHERQGIEAKDGEEEAEFKTRVLQPVQASVLATQTLRAQQLAQQTANARAHNMSVPRQRMVTRAAQPEYCDEDEGDDDVEEDNTELKNVMEAKQKLLHHVATEIVLNTRLHGELTCFRSVFASWNPLLPHETILTILEFFGVSEKWRTFFKTYLQAPLKFADDRSSTPRLRRRGTPGSHTLSDVFSEVVLACLDFAVNQSTDGEMLYRLYDDIWFWSSDYEKCKKAWRSVLDFAAAMHVQVDDGKTGSVRIRRDEGRNTPASMDVEGLPIGEIRWGFLYLDETTGRFEIDEKLVDGHIEELRTQLQGKSKSIIDWIQAWNTYAATFFSSNFGKPANCFGRGHVDKVLATHRRIQEQIFEGGNVVQFLKRTIEERFEVKDIPEGFLFFPVELGGLDLKSPFVGLLQIRESVKKNPHDFLDEFEKTERRDFAEAKLSFDRGDVNKNRRGMEDPEFRPGRDADTFFSFEEYVAYREEYTPHADADIIRVYRSLMKRPKEESIDLSVEVKQAVDQLSGQSNLKGITNSWANMKPYWKWVAQMYGPEMCDRFGGLNVVEPGLLPTGMVSVFREKRIKWQG